jgi:hypothetical protein
MPASKPGVALGDDPVDHDESPHIAGMRGVWLRKNGVDRGHHGPAVDTFGQRLERDVLPLRPLGIAVRRLR